jgi:hypothetical protein
VKRDRIDRCRQTISKNGLGRKTNKEAGRGTARGTQEREGGTGGDAVRHMMGGRRWYGSCDDTKGA